MAWCRRLTMLGQDSGRPCNTKMLRLIHRLTALFKSRHGHFSFIRLQARRIAMSVVGNAIYSAIFFPATSIYDIAYPPI